jgi:6-phosphogluconolactonase (cycloisomerase 2 family)
MNVKEGCAFPLNYASNRGHESIAMFRIGGWETHGFWARFRPKAKRLAALPLTLQETFYWPPIGTRGSIVVLRIDSNSRLLKPTGDRITAPTPVCIVFVGA